MNPHRDLAVMEEYVDLHRADTIDPRVCLAIVQNPDKLLKAGSCGIPLSRKLRGHLPRKILQYRGIETFDNPENRFVKRFIKDLLFNIGRIIEAYGDKLKDKLEKLRGLKENLEVALQSECLQAADESGPASIFSSQVLFKKEGYRELLQAYNKLLLSKLPVFTYLQEKINQRRISEIYEFWCFFELSKKLEKLSRSECKIKVETTLEEGLAQSEVKSIISDYELIYNKKFTRSERGSYSVPLRPDFVLQKNGKPLLVFDSKFRFDIADQNLDLEIVSADENEEEAIHAGSAERIAKISDVFKMHTYRDALNVKSALILYPGDRNVFFSKHTHERIEKDEPENILEMICPREWRKEKEEIREEEGIGYLSFIPTPT